MKYLKRFTTIQILLLMQIMLTGFDSTSYVERRSASRYEGEFKIAGLKEEVTVFTDERGMPHIYASNEHDLYMAVGYVTASERLWQMDLIRRSANGRLSEVFGTSFVESDIFMRCLKIAEKSEKILSQQTSEVIESMQAYADGVNTWISSRREKLPIEFRILSYAPEEWTTQDIASIVGYMGWSLTSRNLTSELFYHELVQKFGIERALQLIPDWKSEAPLIYPDFRLDPGLISGTASFIASTDKHKALGIGSFCGSNSWAVTGSKSETGKPLLSNDMHLTLGVPGVWMQMHQVIPGKLNVTGVLIPGEPFIVAGHNEKIAWGMTNLMVDDVDLYAEKINPENNCQYYLNGAWAEMTVKNEIIKIKKHADKTVTIRFTHRGPIVSDYNEVHDVSLSMKWSGYEYSDEIRSVYLINRAENWDDFRSGLSTFRSISQNFIYADTEGNIGIATGGGIPLRKGHGSLIKNGETDEYDWSGHLPFEYLPYSYNPDNCYVSSANNKTVGEDYPYYISSEFVMPYRIERIRKMLDGQNKSGIGDFRRMLNDQQSEYAALLTPYIMKLRNNAKGLTVQESAVLDTLAIWDYDMNRNLIAPTVFEYFRLCLRHNLFADEMEELYSRLYYMTGEYYVYRILKDGPDEWVDNISTPELETFDDIVFKSYKGAIDSLNHLLGNQMKKWAYGKVHTLTLKHPLGTLRILDWLFRLNSPRYRVGGSDHTVSPYFSFEKIFSVTSGASEKHIFNTADWDESLTIIPGGVSGMPSSEFYLSQLEKYISGDFYKDPFTENAVRSAAKYTLKLIPEKY